MPNSKMLYVEGGDDLAVAAKIAEIHGFNLQPGQREFEIKNKNNIDGVLNALREAMMPEFELERLGVMIDRDSFERNHWTRVKDAIRGSYNITEDMPHPNGTIIQPLRADRPRLGVWIMPNNTDEGMLEDFIITMIRPADQLYPYAQGIIQGVPEGPSRFANIHKSKATIHTWLAWQQRPGCPFGTAIEADFLDPHSALATTFANWLIALYR